MLGDLVELATAVVDPDHTPDINPHIHGAASSKNMAGSRRRKSQSVASTADANGMPPPASPSLTNPALSRKPRSRSTTSPIGSPKPIVSVLSNSAPASPQSLSKYVAAVVLSILVEAGLQSLTSTFLGTGELAAVSKRSDSWLEIGGLLVWKIALITFYWFGGFDAFDVLSLTLLITTPQVVLLSLFYQIRSSTLAITTATTIFSHALPYLLFRPLSPPHKKSAVRSSTLGLRNRSILTDPYTSLATSLLGTTIFAVLLELAFATFLPSFLIANFTGLRTLDAAHAGPAGLLTLLVALVPAGWACMEFLFAPSTSATSSIAIAPGTNAQFDPVTSGFWAHVYWNVWGWYSIRQKELIWRAAVLGALVAAETMVFCTIVLDGVTVIGGLGYSGLWAAGVAVLGGVLDWVGGPSD